MELSPFTIAVMKAIRAVPRGKVATYGQIAIVAKRPGASRGVAWILHSCSTQYKLPWHRIIGAQGVIAFKKNTHNFREQRRLLEKEGVIFSGLGKLNLAKYQWKKGTKSPAKKKGPRIFS